MAWWLPQFLPKPASVDLSGDLVTVNRAARDHAVDLIRAARKARRKLERQRKSYFSLWPFRLKARDWI